MIPSALFSDPVHANISWIRIYSKKDWAINYQLLMKKQKQVLG